MLRGGLIGSNSANVWLVITPYMHETLFFSLRVVSKPAPCRTGWYVVGSSPTKKGGVKARCRRETRSARCPDHEYELRLGKQPLLPMQKKACYSALM